MKKIFIMFFLCSITLIVSAQNINHNFQNVSMSDVLHYLSSKSTKYTINFIYNELEDFRVTTDVHNKSIPDAIRQVIGFYPISMKVKEAEKTEAGEIFTNEIYIECIQKESSKVIGHVLDENGKPMEFVNVSLLNLKDSSFINGGVSNATGYFAIPYKAGPLLMKISYIGYKTLYRKISDSKVGYIRMVTDSYHIKGITIKGSMKTNYVDKSVYAFSDEQIKNARQSQDLLATLPGLYIDPQSGKVNNMMGKSMKILLNGIEVKDNDLKTIPADKIKNVEYYTEPPAKYGDIGLLINVTTKRLDTGYAVGTDLSEAFTTGFGDNNIYFRYNQGHHQISFDYSNNIRNYRNRHYEQHYTFTQDDGNIADYLYQGHDHFGYTVNDFNLKYAYSKPDDITFQATVSPSFLHVFSRGKADITANNNPDWQNGKEQNRDWTNTFGPSVDIYLDKMLPYKQKLTIDMVGTYYHNKQQKIDKQLTQNGDSTLVDDQMNSQNNKYSLIGEVDYEKNWKKNSLSFGYMTRISRSDYTISNVLSAYQPYDYSSSYSLQNLYGEYQGTVNSFMYRIGIKANYIHTSNDDTHFSKLYATPTLLLAQNFKNSQLKFHFGFGMNIPSVSNLSNNSSVIIPGLISQGNPYLKAGGEYDAIITYTHHCSYWDVLFNFGLIYTDKPQSTYYQWKTINGQRIIVSSYENANYMWQRGGGYQVKIKPFKSEIFTIGVSGYVQQYELSSNIIGKHLFWYTPVWYNISFRKNNFGASYYGNIPSSQLDGTYLSSDENKSHLTAFYQKGQWRFTAMCLWIFTKSKYSSKTIDNSVMNKTSHTWINDNKSMICLGVSWNFFSGKHKKIEKNINNKDYDSGTF